MSPTASRRIARVVDLASLSSAVPHNAMPHKFAPTESWGSGTVLALVTDEPGQSELDPNRLFDVSPAMQHHLAMLARRESLDFRPLPLRQVRLDGFTSSRVLPSATIDLENGKYLATPSGRKPIDVTADVQRILEARLCALELGFPEYVPEGPWSLNFESHSYTVSPRNVYPMVLRSELPLPKLTSDSRNASSDDIVDVNRLTGRAPTAPMPFDVSDFSSPLPPTKRQTRSPLPRWHSEKLTREFGTARHFVPDTAATNFEFHFDGNVPLHIVSGFPDRIAVKTSGDVRVAAPMITLVDGCYTFRIHAHTSDPNAGITVSVPENSDLTITSSAPIRSTGIMGDVVLWATHHNASTAIESARYLDAETHGAEVIVNDATEFYVAMFAKDGAVPRFIIGDRALSYPADYFIPGISQVVSGSRHNGTLQLAMTDRGLIKGPHNAALDITPADFGL